MDGSGYFFWSYKLGCIPWPVPEWSMLQAVEHGTMPAHVATCDGDECAGHSWECYWDYPRRNTPYSPPPPAPEAENGEEAPASSQQAKAPGAEEEAGVAEEENHTSSPDGGEQHGVEGSGDAVSEASGEVEAAEETEVEAKPEEGLATEAQVEEGLEVEAEVEAKVEAKAEAKARAQAGPQQAEEEDKQEGEQEQERQQDAPLLRPDAAMMSEQGEARLHDARAATDEVAVVEAAAFVEQTTEAEDSVTPKDGVWSPPPPPATAGQAAGTGLMPSTSLEGGAPGAAVVGSEREWRPVAQIKETEPLPRQLPSLPASKLNTILTAAAAVDVLPPALRLWREGFSRPWAHNTNITVTFARGTSQEDANTPW
jgi:hypothetical protein